MHATRPLFEHSDFPLVFRKPLEILQVNLGYLCNLSCVHCHVNAGPTRTELMDSETIEQVLSFAQAANIQTLDLTGGAPEMHPSFQYLVGAAREMHMQVIDRCNLVILEDSRFAGLAEFLAGKRVEITASLPCYLQENVDKQRGKGVFKDSIAALQRLNHLGYGEEGGDLRLNLVYNPQGAALPPAQQGLESAYKAHLREDYGIIFNRLYAIANMPIQRFGSTLVSKGQFDAYMRLLRDNFNADNLHNIMCLNTLSIDWQGTVYDCDFNQMLQMSLGLYAQRRTHISELTAPALIGAPIATAGHCYGCTAGQGSSCGGAIADA
jgi:radical SAM/Cys-rich protein